MSVIVLTSNDPGQARNAIDSLRSQTLTSKIELILVRVNGQDTSPDDLRSGFWGVLAMSDEGRPFGATRAAAVRGASAPVVAFLEDHCLAEPHWAEALLEAIGEGWDGVGCEIHNASAGIGISGAVALMNYAPWMAPATRRQETMIPGHNAAYRRASLLSLEEDLDELLRSDTALNMRLVADGRRLLLEPAAKVAHANETGLADIMKGYYLNTRSMTATRREHFNWGIGKITARILLWPLVPLARLLKLWGTVLFDRRDLAWESLKWTPVMFVAWLATGWGQAMGLAFGIGNADRQFLDYEASHPRPMAFQWPSA